MGRALPSSYLGDQAELPGTLTESRRTLDAAQLRPPSFSQQWKSSSSSRYVVRGKLASRVRRAGHPHIIGVVCAKTNLAGVLRLLAKCCLMRRHKMIFIAFQMTWDAANLTDSTIACKGTHMNCDMMCEWFDDWAAATAQLSPREFNLRAQMYAAANYLFWRLHQILREWRRANANAYDARTDARTCAKGHVRQRIRTRIARITLSTLPYSGSSKQGTVMNDALKRRGYTTAGFEPALLE